jgi:hypothetical protein
MNRRINILLPEATIRTIDSMARPGQRSRFIDTAVRHFVTHNSTEALRSRLEQTALRDRDLDLEIASDWSVVDRETWQQLETRAMTQPRAKTEPRAGGKSTSPRSIPQSGGRSKKPGPRS